MKEIRLCVLCNSELWELQNKSKGFKHYGFYYFKCSNKKCNNFYDIVNHWKLDLKEVGK